MNRVCLLGLGLCVLAGCSAGTVIEGEPTNERGTPTTERFDEDGDPGPADAGGDLDPATDDGEIADQDVDIGDGDASPADAEAPANGDGDEVVDAGDMDAGDQAPTEADSGMADVDDGDGDAPGSDVDLPGGDGDDTPVVCDATREVSVPLQMPWRHWPEGEPIHYDQNPPAGGQSYEMWGEYRAYSEAEPLDRGHWNHNLRHGGIVMLYRTDAPEEIISRLEEALPLIPTPDGKYQAHEDCPSMGILTPDDLMEEPYAVLAWGKMLTGNCAPELDDLLEFADRYVYEAPEKECWDGAWPVRPPCYRFETVRFTQWTFEVPEGTAVEYDDYPPSSGPFYPETLAYGRYDAYVPAPYWTKILANGGVVVLYRPDADPALIAALKTSYDALSPHWKCGHSWTAMVQDPNLTTPYAMVANNNYMHGECYQGWEMGMFVSSRRGWGPLDSCDDGTFVPEEDAD